MGLLNTKKKATSMPKNASKSTARKAYYTAVSNASKKQSLSQKARTIGGSWGNMKTSKKSGTSSLKMAGQNAKKKAR